MITLEQMAELYPLSYKDIVTIEFNSGEILSRVSVYKTFRHDGNFVVFDQKCYPITIKDYKKIKLHRD